MIDVKRWLDDAAAEDSLFEGALTALACAVHDKVAEELRKAKRDLSHLVPVKKFRVHPRGGVHVATYYINPEKVKPKEHPRTREELAHEHISRFKDWAERMVEYYDKRAQFFSSNEAYEFARKLEQQLIEGKTRLGGEVDRFLEQWGMKHERPTISSPLNAPLMHFIFGATFTHHTPSPEFHEFRDRIMEMLEYSHKWVEEFARKYDEVINKWGEEAAEVRQRKEARNMAVANALTFDEDRGRHLKALLWSAFKERKNIIKGQWVALLGAWSVWTGKPINADVENKLRAYLDAARRKENAWYRYLEHQILEWQLGKRAIERLKKEGVNVSSLTEQKLKEEIEKEWRELKPTAKQGFYERRNALLKELESRRRTAYKKALDLYDLIVDGIADLNPAYKETLEQIKKVSGLIRDEMQKELRLRLKIAAWRRRNYATESLEQELATTQRMLSAFKELHGQLIGLMLAHSATNGRIELPHWSVVSGTIHNILKTRYEHPEKRAWQWELLSGVKDYIAEVYGQRTARKIREFNDVARKLMQLYPQASETVIKFLANERTNGYMHRFLAESYRELAKNPSFNDTAAAAIATYLPLKHFTL